jgi:hypothetical protein
VSDCECTEDGAIARGTICSMENTMCYGRSGTDTWKCVRCVGWKRECDAGEGVCGGVSQRLKLQRYGCLKLLVWVM